MAYALAEYGAKTIEQINKVLPEQAIEDTAQMVLSEYQKGHVSIATSHLHQPMKHWSVCLHPDGASHYFLPEDQVKGSWE
jgi:hypothetical protein